MLWIPDVHNSITASAPVCKVLQTCPVPDGHLHVLKLKYDAASPRIRQADAQVVATGHSRRAPLPRASKIHGGGCTCAVSI